MKVKEIKIGMKVTPFQKSDRGSWNYFLRAHWNESSNFFKENGYLYVICFWNSTHVLLGRRTEQSLGVIVFHVRDFKPYQMNLFETEE